MPVESSEGFERCGGGTEKLVSCRGRIRFADEQTAMDSDDHRASGGGYGCGGEGGGRGRFVSSLRARIQPPKEGVLMIIMVDGGVGIVVGCCLLLVAC